MCCATGESQCFPQGRNANLPWALHFGPGRDQFHDDLHILHLDLEKNPRTWPEDPQISRNVEDIYSFFLNKSCGSLGFYRIFMWSWDDVRH